MTKSRLALTALVIAGLAGSGFAAEAKSHKKQHSPSAMSHEPTTTGANMKPRGSSRAGQGTTGQGTMGQGEPGPGAGRNNMAPTPSR